MAAMKEGFTPAAPAAARWALSGTQPSTSCTSRSMATMFSWLALSGRAA
mgnify:CR=1 FL=1